VTEECARLEQRVADLEQRNASLGAMLCALTVTLTHRRFLDADEMRAVFLAAVEVHRDPRAPKELDGILRWAKGDRASKRPDGSAAA
jgi:hypothetical protein